MKIYIEFFNNILFLKTRQLMELENKLNEVNIEKINEEENNIYKNISPSINEDKSEITFQKAFNEFSIIN